MSVNLDVNKYASVKVGLASPEKILEWSHGEVKKPETINYRSLKPEPDGLFCERIFGPSKNYECYCGKYKKIRFRDIVCEKCGVEITTKNVRRERMGHIQLASPVAHIWYAKGASSKISTLLNIPYKQVDEVVYFVSHIVLNPGNSAHLNKGDVLDEKTARERFVEVIKDILTSLDENSYEYTEGLTFIERLENLKEPFEYTQVEYYISKYTGAEFGVGASALKRLLSEVDLEAEVEIIQNELRATQGRKNQKRLRLLKRLDVVSTFLHSENKPEWMILDVLPVMPPDLRPLIQLDGGRLAASDLNDLYRRLISRNNRLKKLIDLNSPRVILDNERRMLQESVDALIDNDKKTKPSMGSNNRQLKSLSNSLKGKQGRFRQHLLGKRVDYSGRSVIAVGPNLKMHQCGLPREMAAELFKPFIINEMLNEGMVENHKKAERMIDKLDPQIWNIVERVTKNHPVLLNRAPTLHRLSIQAFEPVLVDGKAIRLHPLVCAAFNADFDGDQMAVHVPLTNEARKEAYSLMLASKNILSPKDGTPIVGPSQDMLLGTYYLTTEKSKDDFLQQAKYFRDKGDLKMAEDYEYYATCNGKVFGDENSIVKALRTNQIHIHNRIAIKISGLNKTSFPKENEEDYLVTSVGKIIFNQIFPNEMAFLNEVTPVCMEKIDDKFIIKRGENIREYIENLPLIPQFRKNDFPWIINEVFDRFGTKETSTMLDKLKDAGFKYSTKSAVTMAVSDIKIVPDKYDLIEKTNQAVDEINKMYDQGLLDEYGRYENVIRHWENTTKEISNLVAKQFKEDKFSSLGIIADSGARGSMKHFSQLCGMRGPMANAQGVTIEIPITSSFREGLNISEFFISTHGARKGNTDTALKTADAGYLTRRLVDVAQDIIVTEEDCGLDHGVIVKTLINEKENTIISDLETRLYGRVVLRDVIHPVTKKVIINSNELITKTIAKEIVDAGIEEVEIRSLLNCKTRHGVCKKCYGLNLATGSEVEIGEAVGVMAAQSIGERGTQLTMRTFHTGGVAGADITHGLPRIQELVEARNPKGEALISEISGQVNSIKEANGRYEVTITNSHDTKRYTTDYGSQVIVKEGDKIKNGQPLTEGSINPKQLLDVSDADSTAQYILKEIKRVYKLQGDDISDKHVEVIVRQMLRKISIIEGGDSGLLPGKIIDLGEFTEINKEILLTGGRPAVGKQLILGITKASLTSESFLASASFQRTNQMLTDAVVAGKEDYLLGLKENVIIGKLIPAGTGLSIRMGTDELQAIDADEITIIE